MAQVKKILAIVLAACVLLTVGLVAATAVEVEEGAEVAADSGITVHYYCESGTPTIYYWNSLPTNITTNYPGPAMTAEGNNYYRYTVNGLTKVNMLFVVNGVQSAELTRNTGEWWYKNNKWYKKDPSQTTDWDRGDMREDSIYFVMTTRFYDGDTGNNVHCWDDSKANNPDSDPAWRGDFKGLIEKLDYIKALGFSAIWITPVVTNASGYDYHGYHAFDFGTVDVRYESDDTDYQDLIDAAHEKGMKVIQDVVWNHTGNFGEEYLCKMFTKQYNTVQDLASLNSMVIDPNGPLASKAASYASMNAASQYGARLNCMKTDSVDTAHNYHHGADMSWESYTEQTGQIDGDCVDVNTENPAVANYINDCYMNYVDMGVDAFRLDTVKHISRWTLNHAYFPVYNQVSNFFIFGEVCTRVREFWNKGLQADSCPFYGWKETESQWANNWSTTDWESNYNNSIQHFTSHTNTSGAPTSQNVFLNNMNYHTPDYSKSNRTGVIDFPMHWNFDNAWDAFNVGKSSDQYYNDSTWNVTYVDSHDYAPDSQQKLRFNGGTETWAENLDLMFTFRGIPCIYYGSEVEFQKGQQIDVGPNAPLSTTGRAYFGDRLQGSVTATGFGQYTASGTVNTTLDYTLAKHIRKLNMIRRAVPALQKGQYTTNGVSGDGMAFVRRYTGGGVDSLACVTISGDADFSGVPNGTYVDAVTGERKTVSNGTLSVSSLAKANMRVFVLSSGNFTGISGAIGATGTYLK